LEQNKKISGFSLLELIIAMAVIFITLAAGYAAFSSLYSNNFKFIKKLNDLEKPNAAFSALYDFYNTSAQNANLVERLDTNSATNLFASGRVILNFDSASGSNSASSSAPATLTLKNTDIVKTSNELFAYRVLPRISESCRFASGGSVMDSNRNFNVTKASVQCNNNVDDLNSAMNNLFNTEKIPEIKIGMFNGRICSIIGFESNGNQWIYKTTSNNASGCPQVNEITSSTPTDTRTRYFVPPRVIFFYNQDSTNNQSFIASRSIIENFTSPISRGSDTPTNRTAGPSY
jgi:prepilin-type N-terminal cleavage/methylation domain-containing protein